MPSRKKSPYKDHPLFYLRRGVLLFSSIGLVLSVTTVSSVGRYEQSIWIFALLLFFLSILLVQADFDDWKQHNPDKSQSRGRQVPNETCHGTCTFHTQSESERTPLLGAQSQNSTTEVPREPLHDDPKYTWPRKHFMLADFILAAASFFIYCSEVNNLSWSSSYYYTGSPICQAYISLATLASSLLHARSWWLEFMSRRKQEWEEDQQHALEEQENLDIEAARGPYGPTGVPPMRETNGEESKILDRILGFLRKSEVQDPEANESIDHHGKAAYDENAEALTPASSSTEASTEVDCHHCSDSHSNPKDTLTGSNDVQHEAVLVTKKARSKKGKASE